MEELKILRKKLFDLKIKERLTKSTDDQKEKLLDEMQQVRAEIAEQFRQNSNGKNK